MSEEFQGQFDRRARRNDGDASPVQWVRDGLETNRKAIDYVKERVIGIESKIEMLDTDVRAHIERSLNAIPNRDPIGHLNDHIEINREREERKRKDEEFQKRKEELIWSAIKYILGALGVGIVAVFLSGGRLEAQRWLGVEPQRMTEEVRK